MKSNTSLQKTNGKNNSFQLATLDVNSSDIARALQENLDGQGITARNLERISFPTGGATQWTLQDFNDDEIMVPALYGVVIHQATSRAYWQGEFSGVGSLPACFSGDGVNGEGFPAGLCASCDHNQFGSKGRGKACKETKELFILQSGKLLPTVLSVPPSSIKPWSNFVVKISLQGVELSSAVISFELVPERSIDGVKYSQLKPTLVGALSEEQRIQTKNFKNAFLAMKKTETVEQHVPQHTNEQQRIEDIPE